MPGYTHSAAVSPCRVTDSLRVVSVASSGFCGAVRLPRYVKLTTAVAAVSASMASSSLRCHLSWGAGIAGDAASSALRAGSGRAWP